MVRGTSALVAYSLVVPCRPAYRKPWPTAARIGRGETQPELKGLVAIRPGSRLMDARVPMVSTYAMCAMLMVALRPG